MSDEKNIISSIDELVEKVSSEGFDKINFHCLTSNVPKKCLEGPCILGVDEAGRGPVLGPMVYAVCYCPLKEVELIKSIGCTDSKALTEKKREDIFGLINNNNENIGWAADVISPNYISNQMLKRIKYSLNEIAQNSTIKLIEKILNKNIEITEIYVDTIGPPEKYQRASEMKKCLRLSTRSLKLDNYLSGGLPVKGITEICGESGSGKSQLCMQLALAVQYSEDLGGLNGGAVYICSEEPFPSKRLYQMINKVDKQIKIEFSNNIFILHVADYSALENNFKRISNLVRTKNIKLVVLDSVTALFRGNTDGGRKKAKDLRMITRNFYKLHAKYGVMIVCVNQVSDSFSSKKGPVPALGLAWANLVTTRIQLRKSENFRTLEVVFSPEIPHIEIQFEISESGAKLLKIFPDCKITVEKKADSLYPVVGAASICAKVLRDTVIEKWKFPELISTSGNDFGTGYPGDPKSKQFLLENRDDIFGFPHLVRFSWSTAEKLLEEATPVEWEVEDEASGLENKNISKYFKTVTPLGEKKHKSKSKFFKERSLSSVESF